MLQQNLTTSVAPRFLCNPTPACPAGRPACRVPALKLQHPRVGRYAVHCILLLAVLLSGTSMAQRPVPELWGMRVHDDAKVLSTQTVQQLENRLKVFEDSTTNQVAVLIIQSLEGEILESYSLKVAEAWKLGTKNNDNGVLLLIAIADRKMRIEVGQGLEGVLTDALSSRIIRNEIAPYFRRQEYDAGVTAGVNAILQAIKGEYSAVEDGGNASPEMSAKDRFLIGLFVFGILFIFTFFALFSPGCAGWGLYAFSLPFYATFPMAVLGSNGGLMALATYALGLPILKMILPKTAWGKRMAEKMKNSGNNSRGGGWSTGGGWFMGGGGGGWSSGGGGGFSGGGGSFGGGGSSGSW